MWRFRDLDSLGQADEFRSALRGKHLRYLTNLKISLIKHVMYTKTKRTNKSGMNVGIVWMNLGLLLPKAENPSENVIIF